MAPQGFLLNIIHGCGLVSLETEVHCSKKGNIHTMSEYRGSVPSENK